MPGEILLGGKFPFVRTKKNVRTKQLSGQKNCPDKKIVQTKKLSEQQNCPDKKIVRTKKLSGREKKNCLDKKIVRTKKNCPDKFFLSALAMPLVFFSFCPSGS